MAAAVTFEDPEAAVVNMEAVAFNSTVVGLMASDRVGEFGSLPLLSSSRIVMGHTHAFTLESKLALK